MSDPQNMLLNLEEMISGYATNLRYVNRFATSRSIVPENVAEHSFYVSWYSYLLARWVWFRIPEAKKNQSLDEFMGVVLQKAIIHDIEESRSGDIHRPFKYSHPDLKAALDVAADHAAKDVFKQIVNKTHAEGMFRCWQNSKDGSFAGCIVAFADYLSVLSFVKQEGPDAPKRLCLETMDQHVMSFQDPKFEFLQPMVDEAIQLTKEIFDGA